MDTPASLIKWRPWIGTIKITEGFFLFFGVTIIMHTITRNTAVYAVNSFSYFVLFFMKRKKIG